MAVYRRWKYCPWSARFVWRTFLLVLGVNILLGAVLPVFLSVIEVEREQYHVRETYERLLKGSKVQAVVRNDSQFNIGGGSNMSRYLHEGSDINNSLHGGSHIYRNFHGGSNIKRNFHGRSNTNTSLHRGSNINSNPHVVSNIKVNHHEDNIHPPSTQNNNLSSLLLTHNIIDTPVPSPQTPSRVFYNRVPKCGSSTMIQLIHEMKTPNNYTFHRSSNFMKHRVGNMTKQRKYIDDVLTAEPPMVFERHVHYINFTKHGLQQPAGINILRDPLERLRSWYYFRRFSHPRKMPKEEKFMKYNDCILRNHTECIQAHGDEAERGYFKLIPFFCGQEKFCIKPTEKSLQLAIHNLLNNYIAVGFVDRMEDTMRVFEYLLPTYFKGLTKKYKGSRNRPLNKNKSNTRVEALSPLAKTIIQDKLKLEYEFYNIARLRFQDIFEDMEKRTS